MKNQVISFFVRAIEARDQRSAVVSFASEILDWKCERELKSIELIPEHTRRSALLFNVTEIALSTPCMHTSVDFGEKATFRTLKATGSRYTATVHALGAHVTTVGKAVGSITPTAADPGRYACNGQFSLRLDRCPNEQASGYQAERIQAIRNRWGYGPKACGHWGHFAY